MSQNHSVAEVFDALIKQTQQRGGCPSVREISDASLAVANMVAAYAQVRAYAVEAGMSQALARAIENADAAVAVVEGKKTYIKVTYQDGNWCICDPKEVADMTAGAEGYTTEEVQMTEAEFDALPEFQC